MNCPPNIEEIRKYAEEIKLDVKYLLGEKYYGNLFLSSCVRIPSNVVFNVVDSMFSPFIVSLPSDVVFNVSESLYLNSVRVLSDNIVFNVGNVLDLQRVESIHSSVQFVNCKRLILPTDKKVKIIW